MLEKDKSSKWRVVLAIALSGLIIVLYSVYFAPKPDTSSQNQQQQGQQQATQQNKTDEKQLNSQTSAFKDPQKKETDSKSALTVDPKKTAPQKDQKNIPIPAEKIVKKTTNRYTLEFSTHNAVLKTIRFNQFLDKDKKPIDLSPMLTQDLSPFIYELKNVALTPYYQLTEEKENSITFTQETPELKVEKQFIIDQNNYDIKLNISITNKSGKDLATTEVLKWGKSAGPFLAPEKLSSYDQEFNVSYFDRAQKKEEKFSDEVIERKLDIDWISLDNRYFFVAIIPDTAGFYSFKLVNHPKQFDQEIALISPVQIQPKAVYKKTYTTYMGPKDERILKSYNRNLEALTERGFAPITLIGKGIKWLLFAINDLINNFGITIIILSLIFKILLHPLSKKSMESAKKMQTLGPQMEAIKQKYGDNKQEMNQKIWELYRREKINPASGCLPLLLQMPFFFALYGVLPYVIELKNVNFLWIHDLSSPDTIFYIESFKNVWLLPYQFNVLPILLTIFSYIQTKVSQGSGPGTSQTKMMEYLMPVLFLFIFWTMPSGLVLYWLMQTIFTIVHQYYINKRPPKNKDDKKDNKSKKKLTKKAA